MGDEVRYWQQPLGNFDGRGTGVMNPNLTVTQQPSVGVSGSTGAVDTTMLQLNEPQPGRVIVNHLEVNGTAYIMNSTDNTNFVAWIIPGAEFKLPVANGNDIVGYDMLSNRGDTIVAVTPFVGIDGSKGLSIVNENSQRVTVFPTFGNIYNFEGFEISSFANGQSDPRYPASGGGFVDAPARIMLNPDPPPVVGPTGPDGKWRVGDFYNDDVLGGYNQIRYNMDAVAMNQNKQPMFTPPPPYNPIRQADTFVRTAANGVTLGGADHLAAFMDSRFNGESYAENLERQRRINIEEGVEYPVTSKVGAFAGVAAQAILLHTAAGAAPSVEAQFQANSLRVATEAHDAFAQGVSNGSITLNPKLPYNLQAGNFVDQQVRAANRVLAGQLGLDSSSIRINQRLYAPDGSYTVPDIYFPKSGNIIDYSYQLKTINTPQIQSFIKASPNGTITIVSPAQIRPIYTIR